MKLPHVPVLCDRVVESWAPATARRVVDGTVGRAGHSLAFLGARPGVQLRAFDRDPEAVAFVQRRFSGFGERATCDHGSYGDLLAWMQERDEEPYDGILLDLGVSSPQIDDPARGFSIRGDGPLDLRFDTTRGLPVAAWLAQQTEPQLTQILREYGEVPRARRVAVAILQAHDSGALTTTGELLQVLTGVVGRPGEPPQKAQARVFQALRIAVNGELDELDRFLASLPDLLAPSGRIVILSYHSLEDRRVKHSFREATRDCLCPSEFPVCVCGGRNAWLRLLTKRPITASATEVAMNPRARSVRMRVAERIGGRPEGAR